MKFLKLSLISLVVCLSLIFSGTFSFSQPTPPNISPPVPFIPNSLGSCQGLQVLTAPVCPGDGIDTGKEARLARLINTYRGNYGLPPIPLSPGLSMVANRHVMDLVQNIRRVTHAFSNCPYDGNNPQTYPCMWQAPQRLGTGYPGTGYEIAFGGTGGFMATPRNSLRSWQNSPGHNAVILNQGIWANRPWKAMGVGINQGFAVVWFGEEPDRG